MADGVEFVWRCLTPTLNWTLISLNVEVSCWLHSPTHCLRASWRKGERRKESVAPGECSATTKVQNISDSNFPQTTDSPGDLISANGDGWLRRKLISTFVWGSEHDRACRYRNLVSGGVVGSMLINKIFLLSNSACPLLIIFCWLTFYPFIVTSEFVPHQRLLWTESWLFGLCVLHCTLLKICRFVLSQLSPITSLCSWPDVHWYPTSAYAWRQCDAFPAHFPEV